AVDSRFPTILACRCRIGPVTRGRTPRVVRSPYELAPGRLSRSVLATPATLVNVGGGCTEPLSERPCGVGADGGEREALPRARLDRDLEAGRAADGITESLGERGLIGILSPFRLAGAWCGE